MRIEFDRAAERKFSLSMGISQTPVGTCVAFVLNLPGLIKGFHQKIVKLTRCRRCHKFANELRLICGRCASTTDGVAMARPAYLADQDRFIRKAAFNRVNLKQSMADGVELIDTFPVRQQVDRDEIDLLDESRVVEPHVPRFGT